MNGQYHLGPPLHEQAASLLTRIKPMTNQELKEILKAEGLPITGVKALLQQRISDRKTSLWCAANGHATVAFPALLTHGFISEINRIVQNQDQSAMARITHEIHNRGRLPPSMSHGNQYSLSPPSTSYGMSNGYSSASYHSAPSQSSQFHSTTNTHQAEADRGLKLISFCRFRHIQKVSILRHSRAIDKSSRDSE